MLADAGVERLIDVRELPISRRRGFAKTALGEALAAEGVEYLHMRSLGNPSGAIATSTSRGRSTRVGRAIAIF